MSGCTLTEATPLPLCDQCGTDITGPPVQDAVARSWLGEAAPKFCNLACMAAYDEKRITADGAP